MTMDKPDKCKNCQWYGKPYWSIVNPCDNCPMENVETFTRWVDPTIKEKDKEIERLNNIMNEFEKWLQENIKISKAHGNQTAVNIFNVLLDKLKELKGDDTNG